jgi:hypothetical protein
MQPGDYFLSGVMEVASGFRFNPDGTFDFFFTYGAVDRSGSGVWEQRDGNIVLNSPPKPAKDFILQESRATADKELVIQITDPNARILGYVVARIKTQAGHEIARADENGRIALPRQPIEEIGLVHELWPDRPSCFAVSDPALNQFVFSIDPRITEVEFRDLVLREDDEGLSGGHPLLEGAAFRYNWQRGDQSR